MPRMKIDYFPTPVGRGRARTWRRIRILISVAGILACSTLTVGACVGMFGLLTDPDRRPGRLKVICMWAVVPIGCLWWTWTAVRSLWGEVRPNDVGDGVSSDDAPGASDETRMT